MKRPWALALAVAAPLALVYLILEPPSGDLAAATYRGDLFARGGFILWDGGWYGGHYLPGYSLLAPALGTLAGERLLLALCALAASGLFGLLARRTFPSAAARAAAASFALGASVGLLSGRVAYDLGISFGLLALLVLIRGSSAAALALAALTSLASPVAGSFLALAGLAYALAADPLALSISDWASRSPAGAQAAHPGGGRGEWRPRLVGVAFAGAALAPILALALAFPEGGWQPFAPSLFWPALAAVALVALALPRVAGALAPGTRRMLTCGVWIYALALAGAFALQTPVGSNAVRLGALLGAPLAVGVLWERRRLALALLAPVLLYSQLVTAISDVTVLAGDPSVHASYYAPLVRELVRLAGGRPVRVEVPLTGAHWESVYLPEHPPILLARGWERQLDTRYAALFYRPALSPAEYRSWLDQNAVSYVALPDVRLDSAGKQEGRLITQGLGYLSEVWHAAHWRLFAVRAATPLAQPPALLNSTGPDSFTLLAPGPGAFEVRVRFTPRWTIERGSGSVGRAAGGWTEVDTRRAGRISVHID